MLCPLCGVHIVDEEHQHQLGFCAVCTDLIYRNNERARFIKLLEKTKGHCPDWLKREIEEAIKNKPPFEFEEKDKP